MEAREQGLCRKEPSMEEGPWAATGKDATAWWLWWVGSCLRPVARHRATSAGLAVSRLLLCASLESELLPLPLSPCSQEGLVRKCLYIVGALGSMPAHIFHM